MIGLRHAFRESIYQAWFALFRWRNPHVCFGRHPRFNGIPLFEIASTATVTIGNDVTFVSDPAGNLVGLTKRCSIGAAAGAKLGIGDQCGFSGVSIYCAKEITIGRHLTCGGNVSIWDTDFHPLDYQARRANDRAAIQRQPIVIGDDVFLGANVLVLKGARIGDRAIVAAGSIVTGNVPPDEIWAGNPARFLRRCDPKDAASNSSSAISESAESSRPV
jgi:acetyltransferase-like isoleucine patch superfamily enzyme